MPDTFGALALPTANTAPDLAGDPLISRLLKFLVAGMVDDAQLAGAWSQVAKDGRPVVSAFEYDPTDESNPGFHTAGLPAFFLYRAEIQPSKDLSIGWMTRKTTLHLRYIFSPRQPEGHAKRVGLMNAISSCITLLLNNGRTPSFIIPGDTDPASVRLGSFAPPYIGLARADAGKSNWKPVKMRIGKGKAEVTLPATLTEILIEENFRQVPPFAGGIQRINGLELTLNSGNPPTLTTGRQDLVTTLTAIAPATGAHSTEIAAALSGTFFVDGASVTIGGLDATNVVVVSPVYLTLLTPALPAGLHDVVLTNGDGTIKTLTGAFTAT